MALTRSAPSQGIVSTHSNVVKASWVVNQISDGDLDHHLKAIVDAIKARKADLEMNSSLPPQYRCENPREAARGASLAVVSVDPTPPSGIRAVRKVISTNPGAPTPPSGPPLIFNGRIPKVKQNEVVDASHSVTIDGATYDKRKIVGLVINMEIRLKDGSKSSVPFIITGIGDRSVKLNLYSEPPEGSKHGNTLLHSKWVNGNAPVFVGRKYITRYLEA